MNNGNQKVVQTQPNQKNEKTVRKRVSIVRNIVITFYNDNENNSNSRRKRRSLRNDNAKNLEMVLENLEKCFSVMDFMRKTK